MCSVRSETPSLLLSVSNQPWDDALPEFTPYTANSEQTTELGAGSPAVLACEAGGRRTRIYMLGYTVSPVLIR